MFGVAPGLLDLKLGISDSLTFGFLDLSSRRIRLLLCKFDLTSSFIQFLLCLFGNLAPRFVEVLPGLLGELLFCLGGLA